MKAFADLYSRLDASASNNVKVAALEDYFRNTEPADAAWAVFFLCGGLPRRLVPSRILRELAIQTSGIPEWLFEECYQSVGDLAETISLLTPQSEHTSELGLAGWVEDRLLPLRGLERDEMKSRLWLLLQQLDPRSQLVCIKLITGSFRVGVSKLLVTRALAAVAGIDVKLIAQRLVGYTDTSNRPTAAGFRRLIAVVSEAGQEARDAGQPYPFFLAHSLQLPTEEFNAQLGPPDAWQIEWKWDGIRAQLVKREGRLWLWSRGEELVTDRFPEIAALTPYVPDGTVLDGEVIVWKEGQVQSFALLQQRIGRKTQSPRLLKQAPVVLLAYDLLEWSGDDWRARPQVERRLQLEKTIEQCAQPQLQISPLLSAESWPELDHQRSASRDRGVEGMMLKNKLAHYGVGRTKDVGVWWKWKIEPYTIDAVLIYAQRGHGRRASLYTDFTFGVWDASIGVPGRKLVPFAKAYSGLTDEEMRQVDAIVRKTTLEKFGPMRSVTPTLVFELGFEGIALSSRHKSGIAVRFPRMLRWRRDKPCEEADTLETLRALLPRKRTPELQ
jgi:DNA ligase-1